ncbi:MAG TPA: hypothetical protein VFG30_07955 [Polyangiales bacterium]|nr:hypothetical protein [Polyangiales bacterium]
MFDWDSWGYRSALALLFWLPFSFWLFSRERPARAAAHSLVWGMMWLPEGAVFDLPALPPFSKYTFAAMGALLGTWWRQRSRVRAAKLGQGYDIVWIVMMLGQFGTWLTNTDPLHYGTWTSVDLPGFTLWDGISASSRVFFQVGLPFVLGRMLIRTERDLRDLFEVLVVGGLVYSLPILYELRMSPMLHENIYGFAARTDWLQNLRAGGYRPTAFMGHGLVVGFFMFVCTIAAVSLHKAGKRRMLGMPMGVIVGYLFVLLLLCKAAAPFIYGVVGYVLIRYVSIKSQMRVIVTLGLIVALYPVARVFELFPTKQLLAVASTLGPERVQSLEFRFDNEDILLIKGSERLTFGWGGFGRERVYDAETGKDLVIQDGHWISVFGQMGLLGFACFFALLIWPLVQAGRSIRRIKSRQSRNLLAGLGYITAICAVNMLPNMQFPNLQFYFAAGLAVLLKELPKQEAQRDRETLRPVARPSDPPPAVEEPEYKRVG